MRAALFDTSVLVPALVGALERHSRALPHLQRALRGEIRLLVAAHTLAELYAVLTRLPTSPRIAPPTAERLIRENVLSTAEVVTLGTDDYLLVIRRCADLGLAGGVIYDALIARAAEKAGVDELLTFNARDFRRIWPEGHDIVAEP